jgi:hypothetical protein
MVIRIPLHGDEEILLVLILEGGIIVGLSALLCSPRDQALLFKPQSLIVSICPQERSESHDSKEQPLQCVGEVIALI